jgi:hypothetical protein
LEDRATLVGLAVAGVGSAPGRTPVVRTRFGPDLEPRSAERGPVVVDLSALWAGPLCGALLHDVGAAVVKVESTGRPDGARRGTPAFFDRLNCSKASVALDLDDRFGVTALRSLIEWADVVIESSRPRALQQIVIDVASILSDPSTRPRVWVSITAHGRQGEPERIGFGDDAPAAGGLVVDGREGSAIASAQNTGPSLRRPRPRCPGRRRGRRQWPPKRSPGPPRRVAARPSPSQRSPRPRTTCTTPQPSRCHRRHRCHPRHLRPAARAARNGDDLAGTGHR